MLLLSNPQLSEVSHGFRLSWKELRAATRIKSCELKPDLTSLCFKQTHGKLETEFSLISHLFRRF